jgi:hypothetical protein
VHEESLCKNVRILRVAFRIFLFYRGDFQLDA